MVGERSPAEIERDIEQARSQLASSLDQLADRTSPKRLAVQTRDNLLQRATSPEGKRALAIAAAVVTSILVLSRIRSHRRR
ncbi:MAG: DUF3618 domain-containing protein [bacterium]